MNAEDEIRNRLQVISRPDTVCHGCGIAVGQKHVPAYTIMLELERILKSAGSKISLDRARFLAEKIYQIDYVNPYDKKSKSVLLHTKEQPEVTELLDLISANC